MSHTPGPWKARIGSDPQWWVCGPEGNFHVIATTSQGNDAANARLIAAAPELLGALEEVLEVTKHLDPCQATVEKARSAIAKANGKA